ncbi:retrovirus-related pol polyprotein from transposon TNT 1-94 [Tanacetum coccineum]
MDKTYHITFSEDDEAIAQTNTEGGEINFNENRFFPDNKFLVPRSKIPLSFGKDDYFPYFSLVVDHPVHHEPDDSEPAKVYTDVIHDTPVPQDNGPERRTFFWTKWIFINKMDENGVIIKNKVRLVAQGFRQKEGINYDETFASVARLEAIRIFLAYVSYMGFMVYLIDVKSAFSISHEMGIT